MAAARCRDVESARALATFPAGGGANSASDSESEEEDVEEEEEDEEDEEDSEDRMTGVGECGGGGEWRPAESWKCVCDSPSLSPFLLFFLFLWSVSSVKPSSWLGCECWC